MIRVLFVCLGNICRSPMAEAIFRHELMEQGLEDKIEVDSAGTEGWHTGKPPHKGTREKLAAYQISDADMYARQIVKDDFKKYDYIITMDDDNLSAIKAGFPSCYGDAEISRLMDFVKQPKEKNVPDPYFTGDFDYTYTLVSEACDALLAFLKEKHHI